MRGHCAIASCTNHPRKSKGTNENIVYFRFPKDLNIRKQWIQKCNISHKFNPENCRICSLHFAREDYEDDLKARLLNFQPKKLKSSAVPSLFLTSDFEAEKPKIEETAKSEEVAETARKELVKELLEEADSKSNLSDTQDIPSTSTECALHVKKRKKALVEENDSKSNSEDKKLKLDELVTILEEKPKENADQYIDDGEIGSDPDDSIAEESIQTDVDSILEEMSESASNEEYNDSIIKIEIVHSQDENLAENNSTSINQDLLKEKERKIAKLTKEVRELKKQLAQQDKIMKKLKTFLTEDQIRNLAHGGHGLRRWSKETFERAFKFRFALKRDGYQYLTSTGYPLPGYSTLSAKVEELSYLNFKE